MSQTKKGDYQFHTVLVEDGLYVEEIPDLHLHKVSEVVHAKEAIGKYDLTEIQKIVNIEMLPGASVVTEVESEELTHSDLQAKIILIGNLLGYRTFTPDKGKTSRFGKLGDLATEIEIPEEAISQRQIQTVKNIDVIWFDADGWPTHCFEVEHTTDITKGLLRLYQTHKLRIKMFIVARETSRNKFNAELKKSPFFKIKESFIFRTYDDLNHFFESVTQFALQRGEFFQE